MAAPLIDVVDAKDRVIGSDTIQAVRDRGSWHRYIRVLVMDDAGNYLLQLRGPQNRIFPECWDFAAAAHVDSGETYEVAAAREAAEEIGLDAPLQEVAYYQTQETYGGQQLNRFNKTFRTTVPVGMQLSVDPTEVLEVRWYSPKELQKLITQQPDKVTPALVRLAQS